MSESKFIPLSIPNITGNELKYVTEAIETQWVSTAGGSIIEFEKNFAEYVDSKYACACQSGTAGLHLCLRHFGISENDIVLVPTLTFVATINPILYERATPVFFDCTDNMCIDVPQIQKYIDEHCIYDGKKLIENESRKQVKGIIPVHVFGDTCDIDHIMEIAKKYNLVVIEDAAESLGSKFPSGSSKGIHTGTVAHVGVFSFNGNKIITTGGGGMIVSNDQETIDHVKYLSQQAKDDVVNFVHNEVGYNYRMTNLQAALGLGQLEQLDNFITIKRNNYKLYAELLESCNFGKMKKFKAEESNYWFYSFELNESSVERINMLMSYLEENKIQVRPIWKLNHFQKPFENYFSMDCTQAVMYSKRIINLPCSSNLTQDDIKRVCKVLLDFGK